MNNKKRNNNYNPEKNIEDMSMKEIFNEIDSRNKTTAKNKIWKATKAVLLFMPRMLGAMFGIDKETIGSYNKKGQRSSVDYDDYVPHPPSQAQIFREGYKQKEFNPYDYDMASQMLYYKAIDGKGDPPEHNCDHHGHGDR